MCSCYQENEEDEGEDADEGSDVPDDQPAAKCSRGAGSRPQAAVSTVGSKAACTCQSWVQDPTEAGWGHLLAWAEASALQLMDARQTGLTVSAAHATEAAPSM